MNKPDGFPKAWEQIASDITFVDCDEEHMPKEAFEAFCMMKIAAISQLLRQGHEPVKAFQDGRVAVSFTDGDGKIWYDQIHSVAPDEKYQEWTITYYPVDSEDGCEPLNHTQQEKKFASNLALLRRDVFVEYNEEECPCPNCMARRLDEAHAQLEADEAKNRVLH